MTKGYDIDDTLLYDLPIIPDYIVCDNSNILHRISFYPWYGQLIGSNIISAKTVAIFKIKPKAITLSND